MQKPHPLHRSKLMKTSPRNFLAFAVVATEGIGTSNRMLLLLPSVGDGYRGSGRITIFRYGSERSRVLEPGVNEEAYE
jgi:hypothetical protein